MTWSRCSYLSPIDLTHSSTFSEISERLNSAWRCFQQRIHTQTSNWPQAQQRQSWQGEIELETALCVPANMGWSTEGGASGRTSSLAILSRKLSTFILLAFIKNSSKRICSNNLKSILTIYFLYWWMRELICVFWPSKLSRYPSRAGTRAVRPWLLPKSLMSIGTLGLQRRASVACHKIRQKAANETILCRARHVDYFGSHTACH